MEQVVRTGVDDLMEYLKGKGKVSLLDASAELKADPEIVQSWVDFLVEEGIVGIEYKFTKPFIYLAETETPGTTAKVLKEESLDWTTFRQVFTAKARERNVPELRAQSLWREKLAAALEERRPFFFDEARKRNLAAETLWDAYKTDVLKKAC